MTAGCKCGRRWTGLSQAHCAGDGSDSGPRAGCHRHFGSVWGFDRHRSTGRCMDPATVTRRDGKPFFKAIETPRGTVWAQDNPRGHYRNAATPGKAIPAEGVA